MLIHDTNIKLYTIGKDISGSLILANDAVKENLYFCPYCNSELVLYENKNKVKLPKQPHFTHKNTNTDCKPDIVLRFVFIKKIHDVLISHQKENNTLNMKWICEHCGDVHLGNLLKKTKSIKLLSVHVKRTPDISLLDENSNVFAVINIVFGEDKPDECEIMYYREHKIILIQLNITSDNQLEKIERMLANPDFVDSCIKPKCRKCGSYLNKKEMLITECRCTKCRNLVKISAVRSIDGSIVRNGRSVITSADFSMSEFQFAKLKGVKFTYKFNKAEGMRHLANMCPKCKNINGDYSALRYLITQGLGSDNSKIQKYEIGYFCENCPENVLYFCLERGE